MVGRPEGRACWAEFAPGRGVEQAGPRPVVIAQDDGGVSSTADPVVAVISSAPTPRLYPFLVPVPAGEGGLLRDSHVNCTQIVTVDQQRLRRRMGVLSPARMLEVDAALRYELDL